MPTRLGHDKKGSFYRWGKYGKKYYFYNSRTMILAKQKADRQGRAIESRKHIIYSFPFSIY